MIKEYAKFEHTDPETGNTVIIEANYSDEVRPCKKIRITSPSPHGDRIVEIDHSDLYAMLMLYGTEEEQEAILRVKTTQMRGIQRMLQVRCTKDMKEGDMLQFPYTYYVPEHVYEELIQDPHYRPAPEQSTPETPKESVQGDSPVVE